MGSAQTGTPIQTEHPEWMNEAHGKRAARLAGGPLDSSAAHLTVSEWQEESGNMPGGRAPHTALRD